MIRVKEMQNQSMLIQIQHVLNLSVELVGIQLIHAERLTRIQHKPKIIRIKKGTPFLNAKSDHKKQNKTCFEQKPYKPVVLCFLL